MPTTTNFGWTTPADTDLVKDGAAAIRTFAGNVDTSLVDLKGGTTGQYLQKNSGTDLDYVWADVSAGGMTLISTTTLSGTSTVISSIPSGYVNLFMIVKSPTQASNGNVFYRINGLSTNIYTVALDSVPSADKTFANAQMDGVGNPATTPQTGIFTLEIPDYSNATTVKTVKISGCYIPQGGSGIKLINSVYAANVTAAVTSFTFGTLSTPTGFNGGTVLLYGVK